MVSSNEERVQTQETTTCKTSWREHKDTLVMKAQKMYGLAKLVRYMQEERSHVDEKSKQETKHNT